MHETGTTEGRAAQTESERNLIRGVVGYPVNEPDAYALEEALRQEEEKNGGEVVAITADCRRARSRFCVEAFWPKGRGAIHLEDERFATLDAFNVARAIAEAIKMK